LVVWLVLFLFISAWELFFFFLNIIGDECGVRNSSKPWRRNGRNVVLSYGPDDLPLLELLTSEPPRREVEKKTQVVQNWLMVGVILIS